MYIISCIPLLCAQAADSNIAIRGNINFSDNNVDFFYGTIQVQDFVQFQMHSGSQMNFHGNSGMLVNLCVGGGWEECMYHRSIAILYIVVL